MNRCIKEEGNVEKGFSQKSVGTCKTNVPQILTWIRALDLYNTSQDT